jgi:hypothetical protein
MKQGPLMLREWFGDEIWVVLLANSARRNEDIAEILYYAGLTQEGGLIEDMRIALHSLICMPSKLLRLIAAHKLTLDHAFSTIRISDGEEKFIDNLRHIIKCDEVS